MGTRWKALLLLFCARCAMSSQFESIGALGPLLKAQGVDYGELGILIGMYLAPGVIFALPGGILIQRIGDKSALLLCLLLMTAGGVLALDPDWGSQLVARLISGTGGVILTVAATKMITDQFSGRELATAMGIFVNSWPCGIAISLISLPAVGEAFGLHSAKLLTLAFPVAALMAIAALLPRSSRQSLPIVRAAPSMQSVIAVCIAGAIWGIANAAFATLFSFGPTMLSEKGYLASTAASLVSVVLWVTILAIPLGGMVAARYAKINLIIVVCLLVGATLIALVTRIDGSLVLFIGIGIIAGLPGAAIMSLPSMVLEPDSRAIGMGIFFSIHYGIMLLFPVVQGILARGTQTAAITFDAAAVLLLASVPLLVAFSFVSKSNGRSEMAQVKNMAMRARGPSA
jgi:predicted MFS family arabinose efflux permease